MIKDVLFLLWIFIVPLVVSGRLLFQDIRRCFVQEKRQRIPLTPEQKLSFWHDVLGFSLVSCASCIAGAFWSLFYIPFVHEYSEIQSLVLNYALRGFLVGEVLFYDFFFIFIPLALTIGNTLTGKTTLVFCFLNVLGMGFWLVFGKPSLVPLLISSIVYLIFNMHYFWSYYLDLRRGTKK